MRLLARIEMAVNDRGFTRRASVSRERARFHARESRPVSILCCGTAYELLIVVMTVAKKLRAARHSPLKGEARAQHLACKVTAPWFYGAWRRLARVNGPWLLGEALPFGVAVLEQRCVFVEFAGRDVERATEGTRKARCIVEAQPRGNVLYAPLRKAHQFVGGHP